MSPAPYAAAALQRIMDATEPSGADERPPDSPPRFRPHILADPDLDPAAHRAEWEAVFDYYDPRLRRKVVQQAPSFDEGVVNAVMSDLWERAFRTVGRMRTPDAAWGWLWQIGLNLIKDHAKIAKRRRNYEELAAHKSDLHTDPDLAPDVAGEDPYEGRVEKGVFDARIAELSDRDREFIRLYVDEELSHREIVERLGLPSVDASKQQWRRIKKRLRGEA